MATLGAQDGTSSLQTRLNEIATKVEAEIDKIETNDESKGTNATFDTAYSLIEALPDAWSQRRVLAAMLRRIFSSRAEKALTDPQWELIKSTITKESEMRHTATQYVQKWLADHPDQWQATIDRFNTDTPAWLDDRILGLKSPLSAQDYRRLQPSLVRLWDKAIADHLAPLPHIKSRGQLAKDTLSQAYTDNPKVWGQKITAYLASLDLKKPAQKQQFDATLAIIRETPVLRPLAVPLLDHSPITQQGLQEIMGIRTKAFSERNEQRAGHQLFDALNPAWPAAKSDEQKKQTRTVMRALQIIGERPRLFADHLARNKLAITAVNPFTQLAHRVATTHTKPTSEWMATLPPPQQTPIKEWDDTINTVDQFQREAFVNNQVQKRGLFATWQRAMFMRKTYYPELARGPINQGRLDGMIATLKQTTWDVTITATPPTSEDVACWLMLHPEVPITDQMVTDLMPFMAQWTQVPPVPVAAAPAAAVSAPADPAAGTGVSAPAGGDPDPAAPDPPEAGVPPADPSAGAGGASGAGGGLAGPYAPPGSAWG